ncbi:hypothetical protein [Flavobacterium sp.]|uniref:hypothetical protein n=1 Tax=Flavobacterium sp. TaxID=239 RepID=UPI0038FCD93C
MKYLNLILFSIVFSFTSFGQEKNNIYKKQIDEIDAQIKIIDSNSQKYVEDYDIKPIKNIELEERSWEAYYLKNNEKEPLRIKYNEFSPKKIIGIIIYYTNGEIIFAEYCEKYKKSKKIIVRTKFYFNNSKLIFKTNNKNSKFGLKELLNEEKLIKSGFIK